MSLMCNPLSWGTVLCYRISMASRTRLVYQCGMDVMRLLSSQLIVCCCCACFTMADPGQHQVASLMSATNTQIIHTPVILHSPEILRQLLNLHWFFSELPHGATASFTSSSEDTMESYRNPNLLLSLSLLVNT